MPPSGLALGSFLSHPNSGHGITRVVPAGTSLGSDNPDTNASSSRAHESDPGPILFRGRGHPGRLHGVGEVGLAVLKDG